MKNKGKINIIPIFVLVIGLALLVAAAFALRHWQKSKRMSEGLRLGNIAYEQKDWSEAATQFGYYLSGAQDDIEILALYAECLTKVRPAEPGRLMSAANAYRIIIRNDNTNSDAIEKASDIYIATGNPGEAELVLKDALKVLPDNETLHEKYALSLALQKKLDELIKIKNEHPDQLKAYYQYITELCVSNDKISIATDLLKQVIEKYPKEINAYQSLANLIIQRELQANAGQPIDKAAIYKEIEPWIDQAATAASDDPKLYLMLANYNVWNELYDLALSNLKKALDLTTDDDYLIKIQIASFYARLERIQPDNINFKGMTDIAINICTNIVDKDPQNARAWKALIDFIRLGDDKNKLVKVTENALSSLENTERWDFLPTAIENFASTGENDKAIELISEIEKAKVMEGPVAYWKALIARNNNDTYEEITLLNKAISLGHDGTYIKLQLANAYKRNNDLSSAILYYRRVHEEAPNSRSTILELANLYLKTQQTNEAITYAQKILDVSKDDPDAIAIIIQANIQAASKAELNNPDSTLYTNLIAEISKHIDKFANPIIPKRLMYTLAVKSDKYDDAQTIIDQLKELDDIDQNNIDNLQLSLYLNKSQFLRNQGNEQEAEKLQNQAMDILKNQLQADPENIDLVLSQAGVLITDKQYAAANDLIDQALQSAQTISDKRKLVFAKSDLAQSEDNEAQKDNPQERALNIIEQYLSDNPDDIPALRKTLYFKSNIDDPTKAMAIIEKIKQAEGTTGRIWIIELSRLYLLQDNVSKADLQEAITLLKDAITRNPYDYECSVNLAQLYEKDQQLQLAANLWLEIHNRYLNNIRLADNAIRCLRLAGQTEEANNLLQDMLTQQPDNPVLLGYEVARLMEENDTEQAEAILQKLHDNNTASNRQIISLANIYYTKGITPGNEADKNSFLDKALNLCNQVIDQDGYSFEAYSLKVGALLALEHADEAKSVCDNAISVSPSAQTYLLRARFHYNNDEAQPTIADIEKALTFDDITPADYSNIITLYNSLDDIDNAVKYTRQALKAFPQNVAITRQALSLFLFPTAPITLTEQQKANMTEKQQQDLIEQEMKKMAQDGEQILDQALTDHPDDIYIKMLKSRFLIGSGTKPELSIARNLLSEVVAVQPKNVEAWLLLSQVEFSRLQYQRATDVLNTALQYNPDNPDLTMQKARAQNQISPDLAKATLEKISSMANTDAAIGIRLASIYLSRNEPDQALKLLQTAEKLTEDQNQLETVKILRILASYKQGNKQEMNEIDNILADQPDNVDAFTAKIDMLVFDENWDSISETINKWVNNNPDSNPALLNVVSILLRFQDNPNATKLIFETTDIIIEKEPDNIAALQIQATLSNLNKNIQQAIDRYKKILEFDPENTVAMNNLAWVMAEGLNKPNDALKLAQKAYEINPNYADLNDTIGVIYFRLGNYSKSIEVLEKAVSLYNNNAPELITTFFHLGRSYYMAGNKVDAGKFLQRAKEFNESTDVLSEEEIKELNELMNSSD